jgi:metal-responsive CopG/Arc/MetJ family transcriptional regulator
MDRAMARTTDTTTDLHVALPDSLVAGLDALAHERGVRRVQVLREAVADYLVRTEAERTAELMRGYVEEMGEASAELVAETEAATLTRLLRDTEW